MMIDTGARFSLVTDTILAQLGVVSIGQTDVRTSMQTVETRPAYRIAVGLEFEDEYGEQHVQSVPLTIIASPPVTVTVSPGIPLRGACLVKRGRPKLPKGEKREVFALRGNTGVEAGKVGNMLGTQKRGIEPAIRKWAARVGLSSSGASLAVAEQCRIGTKRAWRLTSGMLDVGRHILGQT